MIVVLTGGTGGAKFIQGLKQCLVPSELTIVVNTGDDLLWWGLHVSPDLDSITYALAGMLSKNRGWGVEGDTFHCLKVMGRLGELTWFQLGDRDLALHLFRTELLAAGKSLAEVTEEIARRLRIESRILPMTNARLETRIRTPAGELGFQEYFVRERYSLPVREVRFTGADQAEPAPGVLEAIASADAVLLAPSNPVTSIGPILAVPSIRESLVRTAAPIGAVSPIIGGAAVSGPAGTLMESQGLPVSVEGIARVYADFLDVLIMDEQDAAEATKVERMGIRVRVTQTLMKSSEDKAWLARTAFEATLQARASAASG